MQNWVITAVALVFAPAIGYVGWRLASRHPILDKRLLITTALVCALGLFGFLLGVSFVWTTFNFAYFAIAYCAAYFIYWHALRAKNELLRTAVLMGGIIPFALGAFTSTIGFLGLGFIIGELEPDYGEQIDSGLTVQTYHLGNAISDYRGLRVTVLDRVNLFPLLERNVADTNYYSVFPDRPGSYPLGATPVFDYQFPDRSLIVRADSTFADTLRID